MTDVTSNERPGRHGRRHGAEYMIYFAIIFLLALPFATVTWLRDVVRRGSLNLRGPLARAWVEADAVTPMIFSA